jgi:PAS domain S-box-containing protein
MLAWMRGPWRGDWSVSLRSYVTAAMLVVLLPLLGHAVLVTWYSYGASRDWAERDLLGDAEHLAEDVDSRLDVARAVMQVISVSPALRRGDLVSLREHFETARASGLIRAALVVDAQGAVLMASGFRDGTAQAIAPGGSAEQVLAGRVEGEPVLTGSLPIRSADPRLARLEFAISVSVLRSMRGGNGNWPWHVTVVTDQRGEMVWSAQSTMGPTLLRQIHDPAATGGVVHDWAAPDGALHTIGYARAPRSGLTVVVAQPSPGLYERVPFGPAGAVAIAIGVTLLSVAMARLGALQLSAAYQAAIRGTRAGPVRIEEAVRLGEELRRNRDRLFQAAGGIAVVELTRPPGRGWEEAEIVASENLRVLAELAPGEALTFERLTRNLLREDHEALAATLARADAQASVFTRLVCTQREGEAPRYFNLVGMLHEGGPDGRAQLMLTLQDVTAQKETELELQAQASRLLLATDIAGLGVWERDPMRGIGHASERLWEIMGRVPRKELEVESFIESVHPDDRLRVTQAFRARQPEETGLPGAPATELRYRIVRPDGSVRHVRSSRVFVEDAAGRGTRVVGVLIDETEAVMAQRVLAASEARFRLAVDVAELGVFERYTDPHRNVGVWNERMWRIRGMEPRAEPMGYEELVAMIHPDDRARIVDEMRNRRQHTEGASDYEFRILRPDGEERIIQSRSVRTYLPEDKAVSIVAINLDVTERRRAEQALAESAARFKLAVETAELGFAQLDPATGKGMWNDRLFRIYGLLPRAERLGVEEMLALVHPDDRAMVMDAMARQRAGQGEDVMETEFRILRADGQERIVHVRSVRLLRADGSETLSTVTQDVTERRRAEQVLAESEARLRLAVETAELGVAELNMATGEGLWNDRQYRICGLDPATPRPGMEQLVALVHPEDRPLFREAAMALRDGADGFSTRFHVRIIRPDGAERVLHVHSITVRPVGCAPTLLSVTQDVTERRAAERALAESEMRLRLATEATGVGIWDHDPLTGASVWTDQMFRLRGLDVQDSPPSRAFLLDLVVEKDRPNLQDAWDRLRQGETEVGYDYCVLWPDGSLHCLHAEGRSLRDAEGRVIRMVGMVMDVTAQREAEIVLLDRNTTLELAIEAADLGIWTRDPAGTTREASARLWAMLGHPGREGAMTREELLACLHPDDRAGMLHDWVPQDGVPAVRQREFRAIWPDGTVHHFQGRRAVMRDPAGHTLRVIGLVADVTEARRSAAALAASETRLRLAVEAAELGVFDYDPDTREGTWSETTWRMRGLEPRAGLPTPAEVMACVHPDDREASMATGQVHPGAPDGTRIATEFRVVWPDGTVRHLMLRAVLHRGEDGRARVFGINIDVTERRLAAQALEESEARLRVASEAAALGVFQVNMPDGGGYWSDRMWRIRGLAPRPGLPGSELAVATVHPEDRDVVRGLRKAAATWPHGEAVRQQFRVVWPDGALRHVVSYSVALHGREEGAFSLIGVNLDITEQVEREQALRETAARFELAIDAAGLAVWDWDPATDRMAWSPRIWTMAGMAPRAEVPDAEERLQAVHPDDRAKVPAVWIRTAGGGDGQHGEDEFRVIRPDGAIRYFRWQGIPLRDATGRIVRFAGVVADVTEARVADLALRTSEELFRMAAEAAEQGVWNHDLATGAITWSARLWRIHGLPAQAGAPTREERIALIHPEDRAEVLGLADDLRAVAPNTVVRRVYRILRADGAVRTVDRQAMQVAGADGRPARIVGVVHDVTEARELAAQTMVADKLATLGEMAGAIAHELAQPLQAVMATAATARMRLAQGIDEATVERVSDRLAWIERQTSRAGKTIQHLLAFSRGESSEGLCRLADALEGAMELAGHGLRRDGVEVSVEVPADLPPVRGGQVEIEQVLVNLLNNARDAMAESPARRIRIEAHHDGDSIRLDVADTGTGVPADKLERIFEPFYTTKPVGRGTGIGLSVARRTMQALGGGIAVANTGRGACFSLTFRNAATGG